MTLEQTLAEVGPIFNGNSFPLASMQDVSTAKQFADEINSGRLSVRDAFEQYWSYEENAEFWDIPKDGEWRALLPAWKNTLLFLGGMLNADKAYDLVKIVMGSHSAAHEYMWDQRHAVLSKYQWFLKYRYNPFYDDLIFAGKLVLNPKEPLTAAKRDVRQGMQFYMDPHDCVFDNRLFEDAIIATANFRDKEAFDELWYDWQTNKLQDPRPYIGALINAGFEEALIHLIEVTTIYCCGKDIYREYQMLAEIKDERCIDALIKCLEDKNRDYARVVIGQKLWDTGNKKARNFILDFIKKTPKPGNDFSYREDCGVAYELDRYIKGEGFSNAFDIIRLQETLTGGEDDFKATEEMIEEVDDHFRKEYGIDRMQGDAEALAAFLSKEKKDYNELHKGEDVALKDLGMIGEAAIPYLLRYFDISPARPKRYRALKILGRIGNSYVISKLLELSDPRRSDFNLAKNEFEYAYEAIHEIHKRIKPQGYNPAVKRLQDDS